jgi:hypothetical protein
LSPSGVISNAQAKRHAKREKHPQYLEHPFGCFDIVRKDIGYLHHQPRQHDVSDAYLEDITAFEFGKK